MRMSNEQVSKFCQRTGQVDKLQKAMSQPTVMEKIAPREEPQKEYFRGIEIKEDKPTKYGNIPTWVNDHLFPSKKEAQYYVDLLIQEKCGLVRNIVLQPKYMLQESFKKHGKMFRAITYTPDFEYEEKAVRGHHWVERVVDTKGKRTEAFMIKYKLFEKRYPDKTLIIV